MTFNLNSNDGFTYTPYKGIYSEFQAGTAFLNAGARYDWFHQSFNPQANVGLVEFGNGPLRYTPISFGYLKGVGFDFRVSFSLGKLMQGQTELHNSFIKNLGYHPGIN